MTNPVVIRQWLLDEQAIRFYAFTGSTEVGLAIQQRAGLRRTQMELGSIAFTVLANDADLDRALPKIINAGYRKAGQVCTSIQILLVHRSIQSEVEARLGELVSALPYGDPSNPDTVVGPVISEAEAQRIERWIDAALAEGSDCYVARNYTCTIARAESVLKAEPAHEAATALLRQARSAQEAALASDWKMR